jgi:Flp pilus assembly protein TadG
VKTKLGLFSRLGKDEHASSPRLLARLLRDEDGSYLLYMTLVMPILIGVAGLATEGGLIFYNHRSVQSAADAAAYSAAWSYYYDQSAANAQTQAEAIVASYDFVLNTGNSPANGQASVVTTVDTTTYSPLTAINVTVTRPQLPILSGIWVTNPFNVGGSAKAIITTGAGGGGGNCIMSLASSGSGIQLQGSASIQNSDATCGIFSNSSISLGGTGSITGGAVGAAGTVSVGGSSSIGPPPSGYTQGDGATPDPYAGITVPSPSATCTNAPGTPAGMYHGTGNSPLNVTVPAGNYCSNIDIQNANVTLNPGTFDGNISVNTGSSLTLNPGTYIFNGPVQLSVTSGSSLTGTGVTLVFTDPSGAAYPHGQGAGNTPTAMDISSGANVLLEAPTSGAEQGMLIIGNSNIPTTTAFNLQANGSATSCSTNNCIGGIIYLPTANFTWQGGPILSGGCTQMIAYTLTLQGSATFTNGSCPSNGGGSPRAGGPPGQTVVISLVK